MSSTPRTLRRLLTDARWIVSVGCILALLNVVPASLTSASTQPPANLVNDAGFETSTMVPTQTNNVALARHQGTPLHSGSHSLMESSNSAYGSWNTDSNSLWWAPVTAGKVYTVSIWAYNASATNQPYTYIFANFLGQSPGGSYLSSSSGSTELNLKTGVWTQFGLDVTVPSGAYNLGLTTSFSGASGSTTIYWDDISITPSFYGPTNFVGGDSGFESSPAVPSSSHGGTLALQAGSPVHSGSHSLAQSTTASSGEWATDNDRTWWAPVTPGAVYDTSVWAYNANAANHPSVVLGLDGLDASGGYNSYLGYSNGATLVAGTWNELSFTVTVPPGTYYLAIQGDFAGSSPGTVIYWDDMGVTGPLTTGVSVDHLWGTGAANDPIPPNPVIDPNSPNLVANNLAPRQASVVGGVDYGQTYYYSSAADPTYSIATTKNANNPFDVPVSTVTSTAPTSCNPLHVPNSATVPTGSDHWITIIDTTKPGLVCTIWQASKQSGTWIGSDGGEFDVNGDNARPLAGSGYAYGGTGGTLASELQAGYIPHALGFAFNCNEPTPSYRYPAFKTDGTCGPGGLEEGMRMQLDPSFDCSTMPTQMERIICVTLQQYGAYDEDSTGSNNISFGLQTDDPTGPNRLPWQYPGDYSRSGALYDVLGAN